MLPLFGRFHQSFDDLGVVVAVSVYECATSASGDSVQDDGSTAFAVGWDGIGDEDEVPDLRRRPQLGDAHSDRSKSLKMISSIDGHLT